MNTVARLAPPALSPLDRRAAIRRKAAAQRRLTATLIGLALPLLAACSSDTGSSDSSAAPRTSSPTAAATDGAATPTIAANGDPFCDIVVRAQADGEETGDTSDELDALMAGVASGTTPVSDLNAWGSTMYESAGSSMSLYDDVTPYVAGTEVESDFVDMKGFVTGYSMPLAAMARDASDGQAFVTEMGAFVQTPEVQSAITVGIAAAQRVEAYTADRCPVVG